MKLCGKCKKTKPLNEFHKSSERGYQSQCKSCKTDIKRNWIQRNREKVKWNALYSRYRLRQSEYEELLLRQNGNCAICQEALTKAQVDHCHGTGKIRGLLCIRCNHLVGCLEQNAELVSYAQNYIVSLGGIGPPPPG